MATVTYRRVLTEGRRVLRATIAEREWTVEHAAERLGMSDRHLKRLLAGYTRPSLSTAVMLEQLLGIKPRQWFRK